MNWLIYGIPCFILGLMAKDAFGTASLRMGSPSGSEVIVSVAVMLLFAYVCALCLVCAFKSLKDGVEEKPPA